MDRFNLNLFFALDAILHTESLTEAARRVHLSQPAMSASLKKLRAYFQDKLIVNQSGGIRLTPLAVALKPRIRQTLQSSREALDLSLDFDPDSDARTVRVSAPDVVDPRAAAAGRDADHPFVAQWQGYRSDEPDDALAARSAQAGGARPVSPARPAPATRPGRRHG